MVNDMAELNIDASLIKKTKLVQAKQEFISMQNGCICCTLRYDLIREIRKIYELGTFDYVIIESTGIAEPMHVAENFVVNPETESLAADNEAMMLHSIATLDTCVTVVDTSEFPRQVKSLRRFAQEFPSEVEGSGDKDEAVVNGEGLKSISELLIEQIEFANVIVLNKCDLLPDSSKVDSELVPLLKSLNPSAKIIPTSHSKVPFHEIINTHLFSMEEAQKAAGWLQSLRQDETAAAGVVKSETEEYGIFSFVYRARKPFHPARLATVIQQFSLVFDYPWEGIVRAGQLFKGWSFTPPEGQADRLLPPNEEEAIRTKYGTILRSKGFCWVASRDSVMIEWNHHGSRVDFLAAMNWYCLIPEADWGMAGEEEVAAIRKDFQAPFGDRRQDIVFIGVNLQREALTRELDACLLNEQEMQAFTTALWPASSSFSALDRKVSPSGHPSPLMMVDPLPAWPLPLSSAGTFSTILREQEEKIVILPPGMELSLHQLTLNLLVAPDMSEEEEEEVIPVAVKVWVDVAPSSDRPRKTLLLCTLRPEKIEQKATNVSFFVEATEDEEQAEEEQAEGATAHREGKDGEEGHNHAHDHSEEERDDSLPVRLYLEVVQSRKRKARAMMMMSNGSRSAVPLFEVHVIGATNWFQTAEDDGEKEEDDHDHHHHK